MEIYRLYVSMTDKISERRERANSFFLTINSALVGLTGALRVKSVEAVLDEPAVAGIPIAIAGITLSYLWYRIVRSYRDLNTAKFLVIHEIETSLPVRPYDAEWEAVGRGRDKKRYLPFTHIEIAVPWVFIGLHVWVLVTLIRLMFQLP